MKLTYWTGKNYKCNIRAFPLEKSWWSHCVRPLLSNIRLHYKKKLVCRIKAVDKKLYLPSVITENVTHWIDIRYFLTILIHQHCDSFFSFFINGFNHRYKTLSLDAFIYVTLHVSVCISVNKLVQIYCETSRKKNRWIFAIPLLWMVR